MKPINLRIAAELGVREHQVAGAVAQGIGTALYERYHYDDQGQLLTANFADYLIPTVHELPKEIVVGHVETPSPFTEYGIKGGGEGGRMGARAAGSRERRRGRAEATGGEDRRSAINAQEPADIDARGGGTSANRSRITHNSRR
jgi:hypothetical protein